MTTTTVTVVQWSLRVVVLLNSSSMFKNIEYFNNKPFDIRLHRPAVFQLYSNSNFVVMKLVHRTLDTFWGLSMTRTFYLSLFF